jgi:hypothetical protein
MSFQHPTKVKRFYRLTLKQLLVEGKTKFLLLNHHLKNQVLRLIVAGKGDLTETPFAWFDGGGTQYVV